MKKRFSLEDETLIDKDEPFRWEMLNKELNYRWELLKCSYTYPTPYGGKEENKLEVERIIRQLVEKISAKYIRITDTLFRLYVRLCRL